MRLSAVLLTCVLQMAALPALAELRYFYCYVPDPDSGTVYVSDVQPIGPVAERAAYGAQFLAYLKLKGIATNAALGYCTMRATEADIRQGQQQVTSGCRECAGTARVSSVQWDRRKRTEANEDIQRRYEDSVRDALRANDPGVCYANSDGSVRCTKGQSAPQQADTSSAPAPKDSAIVSSPVAARAEVCVTDPSITTARRQDCLNRTSTAHEPPKPTPRTTIASPKKRPRAPVPPAAKEEPTDSSPAPPVTHRKTQACTTLPRELDTVIVVVKPEVFVTMTPGTFLYMRDHLGNELKLGYGNHRVRPGTYTLGIYGVTDPFNPLKQTLQACVTHYTDF